MLHVLNESIWKWQTVLNAAQDAWGNPVLSCSQIHFNSQEKGVSLWRQTVFQRVREWLLFSDLQIKQEQRDPKEKEHSLVITEITSCKHKSRTEGGTGAGEEALRELAKAAKTTPSIEVFQWLNSVKGAELSAWCAVAHLWLAEPESATWQDYYRLQQACKVTLWSIYLPPSLHTSCVVGNVGVVSDTFCHWHFGIEFFHFYHEAFNIWYYCNTRCIFIAM